jgi:hypothetical protein
VLLVSVLLLGYQWQELQALVPNLLILAAFVDHLT